MGEYLTPRNHDPVTVAGEMVRQEGTPSVGPVSRAHSLNS
jgi:hypothetical protein